jgi:hypothetical protein
MELTLKRLRGALDGQDVDIACLVEEGAMPGAGRAGGRGAGDAAGGARPLAGPIDEALEAERRAGCALALLIAAGDARRFDRHGFAALPATEAACMSRMPAPWPGEPAWVEAGDPFEAVSGLRLARAGDLDAIVAIHEVMIREQRLRIVRDRAAWEAIVGRHDPDPMRRSPANSLAWVIESGGEPTAYLVLTELAGTMRWREHGYLPGAGDAATALFWGALARSRQRGMPRLEGWSLPPEITGRPSYPVARRPRASAAPLLRPLDSGLSTLSLKREEECRIWELDLSCSVVGGFMR